MKVHGVILLAAYFLARDKENLKTLSRDLLIYWFSAAVATIVGFYGGFVERDLLPGAILGAALIPALCAQGSTVSWIAGAATAFCALKDRGQPGQVVQTLLVMELAVVGGAVFYQALRFRMLGLFVPNATRNQVGRVLILFAGAVLLAWAYQKMT